MTLYASCVWPTFDPRVLIGSRVMKSVVRQLDQIPPCFAWLRVSWIVVSRPDLSLSGAGAPLLAALDDSAPPDEPLLLLLEPLQARIAAPAADMAPVTITPRLV